MANLACSNLLAAYSNGLTCLTLVFNMLRWVQEGGVWMMRLRCMSDSF